MKPVERRKRERKLHIARVAYVQARSLVDGEGGGGGGRKKEEGCVL